MIAFVAAMYVVCFQDGKVVDCPKAESHMVVETKDDMSSQWQRAVVEACDNASIQGPKRDMFKEWQAAVLEATEGPKKIAEQESTP